MAVKIELNKRMLEGAINLALKSRERARKEATNEHIQTAIDQEIKDLNTAKNSITEIK